MCCEPLLLLLLLPPLKTRSQIFSILSNLSHSFVSSIQAKYLPSFMTSHEKGRPLPKFGEWDVNNPASADGFTVIFAKARDEKKANGTAAAAAPQQSFDSMPQQNSSNEYPNKKKWLCCF